MSELDEGVGEQHRRLAARLAEGMPRAGWKICVNDRSMQRKLGLQGPFVGFLDGSRGLESGGTWKVAEGSVLGVEPEIALCFAATLAPDASRDEVAAAVRGAAPAIEVVDWRDARLDLAAMASSSSFHAGFVTGELRPLEAVPAIGPGCPQLRRAGESLGVPDPALMPADVAGLVRDAAAFLGRFGQRIEAGDWLLCGACTNPARVEAGDEIEADFGGLGSVRVRFES